MPAISGMFKFTFKYYLRLGDTLMIAAFEDVPRIVINYVFIISTVRFSKVCCNILKIYFRFTFVYRSIKGAYLENLIKGRKCARSCTLFSKHFNNLSEYRIPLTFKFLQYPGDKFID